MKLSNELVCEYREVAGELRWIIETDSGAPGDEEELIWKLDDLWERLDKSQRAELEEQLDADEAAELESIGSLGLELEIDEGSRQLPREIAV